MAKMASSPDLPVAAILCFERDPDYQNADKWWEAVSSLPLPMETFSLTHAEAYKPVEFWSFSKGIPIHRIVNTGTTTCGKDESAEPQQGTSRFNGLVKVWRKSATRCRGILYVSALRGAPADASSRLREVLQHGQKGSVVYKSAHNGRAVLAFLTAHDCEKRLFTEEAVEKAGELSVDEALTLLLNGPSHEGSSAGLTVLTDEQAYSIVVAPSFLPPGDSTTITARGYARVGVLGNPSDGYHGKTLSVTIENFSAQAQLQPNADPSDSSITLVPHPIFDCQRFLNAAQLSTISSRDGYSGGMRLMQAAIHRFYRHLSSLPPTALPDGKIRTTGFSLRYHTTIPRQVGLAGSSAILTAIVRCLMAHQGLDTPEKAERALLDDNRLPSFVLAIENEELGITAGLQDRVVQAWVGAIHMNFSPDETDIKTTGYGIYSRRLPLSSLPPLFLAYAPDPSDSGRIHAPVKQRWLNGEPDVVAGMKTIGSLADAGRKLCEERPYSSASVEEAEAVAHEWASLFTTNFDTRRSLFGDAALGKDNLRMIAIARETGASAKFPGSGGAVVGVVDCLGVLGPLSDEEKPSASGTSSSASAGAGPDGVADTRARLKEERVKKALRVLRSAYEKEGYVFTPLYPCQ
jgi:galactokinase/mevalonate kinase-like predicted kinase